MPKNKPQQPTTAGLPLSPSARTSGPADRRPGRPADQRTSGPADQRTGVNRFACPRLGCSLGSGSAAPWCCVGFPRFPPLDGGRLRCARQGRRRRGFAGSGRSTLTRFAATAVGGCRETGEVWSGWQTAPEGGPDRPKGPNGNSNSNGQLRGLRPEPSTGRSPTPSRVAAGHSPGRKSGSEGNRLPTSARTGPRVAAGHSRRRNSGGEDGVQRCGAGYGEARVSVTRTEGCPLLPKPPHPR